MSSSTFLHAFLIVDVFLMGVIAATAVRHAYAHFRPHHEEPEKPAPANEHLPAALRQRMIEESEHHFQTILDKSAAQLEHDLETTVEHIEKSLGKLATDIVGGELERYRTELAALRKKAEADMGNIKTEVDKHEAELKAQMQQEVAAEKEQLLQQIDTKLADAVASFLIETLQHNVDLGAQNAYLTSMLEEHKDDFAKGVKDEA